MINDGIMLYAITVEVLHAKVFDDSDTARGRCIPDLK